MAQADLEQTTPVALAFQYNLPHFWCEPVEIHALRVAPTHLVNRKTVGP
jgi:hypothetical protein